MTVVVREVVWGLPAVAKELEAWAARAAAIPEGRTRRDAIDALTRKRPHLDGAVLLSTLHRRPAKPLVRVLFCYEAILELLDNMNERAADAGVGNGLRLHRALQDALRLEGPDSDYLVSHPFQDDGGHIAAQVSACREACGALPSYRLVRRSLCEQTRRARVLALNHQPDPRRRSELLELWARREHPHETEIPWFELSGSATASLTVHALLSLAAEPHITRLEVERTTAVYPRISLLATMLDSYIDEDDDIEGSLHSYISHYGDPQQLTRRLATIISESTGSVAVLPDSDRHAIILASMIALYLTSDHANAPDRIPITAATLRAAGQPTRLLMPLLRAWRIARRLTDA